MIELKLHHVDSLYSHLCLTEEERARTAEFNNLTVYGETFGLKYYQFFEDLLRLRDDTQIKIVATLDDICRQGCPKKNGGCELGEEEEVRSTNIDIGVKVGNVLSIGELKRRLCEFHPRNPYAYWKDENWLPRQAKFPHLATLTPEHFWLTQLRRMGKIQ